MNAPQLKLIAADFFERPVQLRLPFRFGAATLTQAPQMFVQARVRLADGREGAGVSAEMLAPKWFDKSPELTHEHNFDQLRRSLAMARASLLDAGPDTPFGLSALVDGPHHGAPGIGPEDPGQPALHPPVERTAALERERLRPGRHRRSEP